MAEPAADGMAASDSIRSSPVIHSNADADDPSLLSAESKKRNKLGYHRTAVACGHCRRRKIRCIPTSDPSVNRCQNCVRLKKDCHYFPVDQNLSPRKGDSASRSDLGANGADVSADSSSPGITQSSVPESSSISTSNTTPYIHELSATRPPDSQNDFGANVFHDRHDWSFSSPMVSRDQYYVQGVSKPENSIDDYWIQYGNALVAGQQYTNPPLMHDQVVYQEPQSTYHTPPFNYNRFTPSRQSFNGLPPDTAMLDGSYNGHVYPELERRMTMPAVIYSQVNDVSGLNIHMDLDSVNGFSHRNQTYHGQNLQYYSPQLPQHEVSFQTLPSQRSKRLNTKRDPG